jgi:hypothetical protein
VRAPSQRWGGQLVGPGRIVDAPAADVAALLGAHPELRLQLGALLPVLVVLALVIGTLAVGSSRRRLRGLAAALAVDAQAQRVFTALAFAVIVTPMIAPLFAPGFYWCQEGEGYVVRLAEYRIAIGGGVPMGRWWPDPVLGRGYPFLCLYAPLLYILATPFLLAGVSALTTVKTVSGALVIAGAWATYALVRRRGGSRPAALVAIALFTYAPYLQTNLWIRDALAEALGFACFPIALLALERALDCKKVAPAELAGLALALAALGSCHNITAYFSIYFVALWMLLRIALRTVEPAGLWCAFAGGALGLLLTVYYAVPAIFDAQRAHMERVMTGYYDPLRNFVAIGPGLFWAIPHWDMRLSIGAAATLGLAAGVAALLAGRPTGAPLRGQMNVRSLALLAALGVLLALAITTKPLGWLVVKFVPLAHYVQFPWRLFLFAACLAPLCAPAAVDGFLRRPRSRWAALGATVVALFVLVLPEYGPASPNVRCHLDVQGFLRNLPTDYVTSMNEYLPKTVLRAVPRFGEVAHVVDGQAAMLAEARAPGRYYSRINALTPVILEFNAHWFPGWRARLDGTPVAIGPGTARFDDGGLIRVAVPPGRHEVQLTFARTALRLACDAISLGTLFGTLTLLGFALREKLLARAR